MLFLKVVSTNKSFMKKIIILLSVICCMYLNLDAAETFVSFSRTDASVISIGSQLNIVVDIENEHKGVLIAMENLRTDFHKVLGFRPEIRHSVAHGINLIIGSYDRSGLIRRMAAEGRIDGGLLEGANEKFIITALDGNSLVIAGSDKRGTIYGIYELSRQMGVSPWYWWADVPVERRESIHISGGLYTDGEPAVKYRGIFINDEWPCMGNWTTEKFGGFNSKMYVHMYELLLRLKANFLWPAMWDAAFYADDPMNSELADEMGIIIGTSHHEPMARNHQEYARNREAYGEWNYQTNKKGIDRFFREGIERIKGKEDVVTVAMRGDGDLPMGPDTDTRLLENIVKEQRKIISKITGKPASETPQVWALYSEVLEYYDQGMKIPDDVMILLCDDNWGDVRRLPDLGAEPHPGGYGMYYHVDLHGAPRAYQWLNMTQIQHMWEQLSLSYQYGVDKMWILNVGDLKPNEFPTDFFLKMAWDPEAYNQDNLMDYTRDFCAQQFGPEHAEETARILNLYCKYAARISAEMLDHRTYNLQSGEFKAVTDEFLALEAHAMRLFMKLDPSRHDTYKELVLFPVQAMANLYEMYYAKAMNAHLASFGNPEANFWADRVEYCFSRDAELCHDYNHNIAGGKWNHLMDQTHIGYTTWDEPKEGNIMPKVERVDPEAYVPGGYEYTEHRGVVVMEAERYHSCTAGENTAWTVIPDLGRTASGLSLMPYDVDVENASVTYSFVLRNPQDSLAVRLILDSTLPFVKGGHSYAVSLDGGEETVVNYNHDFNWDNCYSKMYPAGAARIIESRVTLDTKVLPGTHKLTIRPLAPAVVLHKIVIDCGSDERSRLNLTESPYKR